jgi:hypothetical protein
MQKNFFETAVSRSKSFFEKIWNKIKNFVSKHELVFKDMLEVLLAILYIAWAIFMLYSFSQILLSGFEENSAIQIALAIAGYIFISWFTYWITFDNKNDKELRQIQRALWDIRFSQKSSSIDDSLTRSEFKIAMLKRKISDNEIKYKLEELERKLDKLAEPK